MYFLNIIESFIGIEKGTWGERRKKDGIHLLDALLNQKENYYCTDIFLMENHDKKKFRMNYAERF